MRKARCKFKTFKIQWHAQSPHLRSRYHSKAKLGINQWGSSLWEVTLVRQQAASAETTWTAQLVRVEEGNQEALRKRFFRLFIRRKSMWHIVPCENIWSIWGSGDRKVPLTLAWKHQWFSENESESKMHSDNGKVQHTQRHENNGTL